MGRQINTMNAYMWLEENFNELKDTLKYQTFDQLVSEEALEKSNL